MATPTSSRLDARKIADGAVLLVVALALSYVEYLIPVTWLIPLPGFKIGLANVAVAVAFFRCGPLCAATVSALRIVISSLLFSGVTTLLFSFAGGALSFIVLCLIAYTLKERVSFFGICIPMAFAHNAGQLLCAMAVVKSSAVIYYFPALAAASLLYGALTGLILNALPRQIFLKKETDL
ncbi:MAG: Gx transporter family protein [Clostridia bacterium]|nr:Gx transporter family protein [Clostridia bacterium]